MTVALTGDAAARFTAAVAYSEQNRRRVARERARVRRRKLVQVRSQLRALEMREPSAEEVEALIDRAASEDPDFKTAVANEQWGARLASMYGLVVIAEQNDRVIALLETLVAEVRRLAVDPE